MWEKRKEKIKKTKAKEKKKKKNEEWQEKERRSNKEKEKRYHQKDKEGTRWTRTRKGNKEKKKKKNSSSNISELWNGSGRMQIPSWKNTSCNYANDVIVIRIVTGASSAELITINFFYRKWTQKSNLVLVYFLRYIN